MADRSDAAGLRRLLRAAIAAQVHAEGWSELEAAAGRRELLTVFAKRLHPDFLLTVQLVRSGGWSKRAPVAIYAVLAGVAYEPLRRLYPLLGDYEFAVIGGWLGVAEEQDDEEEIDPDEDEDEDDEAESPFVVRTEGDVAAVAGELARAVIESAESFEQRPTDVDALLACIGDPSTEYVDLRRAAVLAAAGRFEEADRALGRWKPGSDGRMSGAAPSRTARQLRRWIDSRGDETLIPSSPPPDPNAPVSQPSLADRWREGRRRDAARDHVRANREGKDRRELRAMLEEQLAQQGLNESRIWIESTLDRLEESPADQMRTTITTVGRIGRGLVKLARDKDIPDLRPPDWLDPPERAAYKLPNSRRWIEIPLTKDAIAWLDTVQTEIPSVFGTSSIRAWLSPEPEPRQDDSALIVHLGARRIGEMMRRDVSEFVSVIDAAAFRDELPVVHAQLARRAIEPRYILEIAAPDETS